MLEKTFIVLLCLCSCFFTGLAENNVPPKSKWEIQVSDVQEEIYPAENLCDGQMNTRWSSPAADPQFIWINLGRKCRISGFSLHWETAYSSAYSIALSNDKRDWKEIYSENSGDGKTDFIFFRPQVCQYIKFELKKRATGWGHSLWEIDIHGTDNSFKVISPKLDDPSAILDNNPLSSISLTVPSDLIVDLGRMEKLSGARFDWGSEYARDMTLYASGNMHSWEKVAERENASGKFDYLLSAPFEARYLKLQVKKAIGKSKNVVLTNIKLRGAKESINNYVLCQLAAQKAPAGFYPEQLLGRQVYWTVVGSPDDSYESLLDEYGNFEAFAKACTIMPYLFFDNRLHSALDANEILCELADNAYPMPSVHWRFPELSFTVSAMAWRKDRDTGSFLRYEIKNISSRIKKGTLFLAIRPFQINPIWQHGGLSHINSISCDNRGKPSAVKVNNRINYYAISPPDQFGACAYERGDVIRFIQNESVPATQKISSSGPLASAVLTYKFKLAPGEIKNIYLAAPFHGKIEPVHNFIHTGADIDDAWKKHWNSTRLLWKNQVSKTTLNLPDHDIANTVKSQLAYILLNRDGAAIQPGSRQYERSWIRDGAMTCAALLRWGLHDEVREFIVWYSHFITKNGMVPPSFRSDAPLTAGPGSGIEWDGQGEYISLVMEFYRFSKDKAFLEAYFDKIEASMRFLEELRNRTLVPSYCTGIPERERFIGILPKSFSHEGYYPEMHSYWDDFWALKGWSDGAEAARILGRKDIEQWAVSQHRLLLDSLSASIRRTIDGKKINYIPGCAEKGDFDPTSTSIVFFQCQSGLKALPQKQLLAMYERYYNELKKRNEPGWNAGYSPYESRNIMAFIELKQYYRAWFLLDFLMKSRRPAEWNHWAEVVLSNKRAGCYIGDMPHTWAGSGFLNAVALMLVKEKDEALYLLDGVPLSWLKDKGITLKNRQTYFGTITLKTFISNSILYVDISGDAMPPKGFIINPPEKCSEIQININGKQIKEPVKSASLIQFTGNLLYCASPRKLDNLNR